MLTCLTHVSDAGVIFAKLNTKFIHLPQSSVSMLYVWEMLVTLARTIDVGSTAVLPYQFWECGNTRHTDV